MIVPSGSPAGKPWRCCGGEPASLEPVSAERGRRAGSQGREREWLFAEPAGQWEVAAQCGARRLVLVALGAGHAFASLAAVQAELSPLVRARSG